MDVVHPTTGLPLGITIEIGDGRRALLDWLLAEGAEPDEHAIDAAAVTVGWSGVSWRGEPLAFAPPAAVSLYTKLPWLADQVVTAARPPALDQITADLVDAVTRAVERGTMLPAPPGAAGQYWSWFWALDAGRSSNDYGFDPLSWSDIAAWAALTGTVLRPADLMMLRAMDRARIDASAPKREEDREREKREAARISTRKMSPALFDAIFG